MAVRTISQIRRIYLKYLKTNEKLTPTNNDATRSVEKTFIVEWCINGIDTWT